MHTPKPVKLTQRFYICLQHDPISYLKLLSYSIEEKESRLVLSIKMYTQSSLLFD